MDDLSVQVFNAATSFMLAAALQAAGVPGPFLAIWVGSFTSVLPFSPNVKDVFDIVPLILFNSTYTTVGTPTIPLAAVNSMNFTAISVPAPSVNLDTFIVRRFLDKPALEAALLRKQQSQLSELVADKARAAWGVVEKDSVFSTPSIANITTTLKTLPIGAAELILLAITAIVITSAVVYIRLSRRESGRANADEPQDGLATRHSNAEVEIDCGAPPAVPTSTVDDERVLDDVASSHVERDDGLETSPQSDQPPQIADAVEDLQSVTEPTPQHIPEAVSFDDDTNHSNQPDSSSPSRTASPTPVADESTCDDYDEVTLEDTFISSPTPQDLPSPLDAVNEPVTSDERVLSDDVQTAEDVDDNLSNASSDQSLSDKDYDEVLVSGPREVDQDADTEEFIVEDSSFAKADVDCAADDESEAEDMSDDALISWTKSLKGHMSPDWYETEDEDVEDSGPRASDEDDTPVATVEELEVDEPTFEELEVMAPSPIQPFPFADTDELPCFDIEEPYPLVIEDIFESFSATPEDVEDAMPSPIQPSFPVPTDDRPRFDGEESSSSDVDEASESSSATSEDPEVTTPSATIPSPRMDDDVQLHPDVEVVNAKLVETLENLKAKSSTSPPAAVVPVASPVTPASHSLMHLLPNATHSGADESSEDEQSLALQRVFDKLQASARAAGLEGANEPEDKTIDEAPESVNLEAEPMPEKVDEALVESTEDTEQVPAEENELADQDTSTDSAPSTKQEDRPASPAPVDETPSVPKPAAAAEPEPVSPANEPTAPSVSSSPTPGQAQDERSTDDIIAAELKRHANNLDPENQRRIHGLPPPEVQKPASDATSTPPKSTAALSNSASSTAVPIGSPVTTIYSTATTMVPSAPGMAPTTTPMAATAPTMVPFTTPTQSISVCETSPRRPRVNYPPRLDQQAPLVPPGLSRNVGPCGPVTSRVHPGPQAFRGPLQARAFNQRPFAFNAAPQGLNVPSHGLRAMNPTAPPFAPGPPRGMREFAPHQVPPPPHMQGPLPFNGMHRPPQQMPPQMMYELPPPPGIPIPPPPGLPMPHPPQANLNAMPPQPQLLGPPQQLFPHPGQHFSPMYQMPRPLGMHGPGPQQPSAGPPRFANLAPQGQAFQGPPPVFQGPPMPFPPGLGSMHQGPSPVHQGPSPMHQARPPMLLGPDGHPPMPAFDGPPPAIYDGPSPTMFNGPSPTVSALPGFSPIVSPFRPSLRGEEYMRPAGLFAAPRAPGLAEAPEAPPGLPAPVAPVADVPALVEDVSAPVENAPTPVDDTTAPLHNTLFLTEDARFKSLEADRASGAASAAPRPAHPRVQSPACELDAPERPASAPPVTPETVDVTPETADTTPEMITHVLRWREGGEVRRAVLQSPEDWVRSPKRVDEIAAYGEQARDAGLQVEVENVQQVEHDAPASEETTSAQVPMPSSENTQQASAAPAPQRRRTQHREIMFSLGWGLPARATHR